MTNNNTNNVYIFWLRGISGPLSWGEVVKCSVSLDGISIVLQTPYTFPLQSIVECKVESGGGPTGRVSYVKLKLTNERHVLRLTTLNPFNATLQIHQSNSDDIAFVSIVNALKNHKAIQYDTNPYRREMLSRRQNKFAGLEFDPNRPPSDYQEVLQPKEPFLRSAVWIVITIFFLCCFLLLLAHLLGGITLSINL